MTDTDSDYPGDYEDWKAARKARDEQAQARYDELEPRIRGGVGKGWQVPVGEAALALDAIYPDWKLDQVKEKFGGLRFYINVQGVEQGLWFACHAVADKAEALCRHRCEWCGEYAEPNDASDGTGWMRTLCEYCEKRYQEGYRPWQDDDE